MRARRPRSQEDAGSPEMLDQRFPRRQGGAALSSDSGRIRWEQSPAGCHLQAAISMRNCLGGLADMRQWRRHCKGLASQEQVDCPGIGWIADDLSQELAAISYMRGTAGRVI